MKLLVITVWAFMFAFACFSVADLIAYDAAKFPERTRCGICMFPGGGFYALWKYGGEKDYKPCDAGERAR